MLYADDILLIYEDSTEQNIMKKINEDLTTTSKWMDLNRLILNLEKMKYLFFHTHNYKVSSTNNLEMSNRPYQIQDSPSSWCPQQAAAYWPKSYHPQEHLFCLNPLGHHISNLSLGALYQRKTTRTWDDTKKSPQAHL